MREMRTRARTNSFRIITGLLIAVALIGPLAISVWPEGDTDAEEVRVGLVGEVNPVLARQIAVLGGDQFRFELVDFDDFSQADVDGSLSSDDVDVVVALPDVIVWNESVDESMAPLLREFLQRNAILTRAGVAGISADEVAELLAPLEIEQRFVDGGDDENDLRALGVVGLMTAFMLPQVFGTLTMMSVVEEKSTGVVEVILSHVRPRTLLWGKVSALSLLALPQLLAIMLGALAAMSAASSIEVSRAAWQHMPALTLSIFIGVVFYNTLFALLGSLISRQEDSSQVMMPVFVPLAAAFFVGQTALAGSADTLVLRVVTFIPLTSPMILPVRVARSAIAPWEIAASLLLLVIGAWLLLALAARVYELALLHRGSRIGWGQTWRLVRGGELV